MGVVLFLSGLVPSLHVLVLVTSLHVLVFDCVLSYI